MRVVRNEWEKYEFKGVKLKTGGHYWKSKPFEIKALMSHKTWISKRGVHWVDKWVPLF